MEYVETKYFLGVIEALVDKQQDLKRELSLSKWNEENLKKQVAELEKKVEELKTQIMTLTRTAAKSHGLKLLLSTIITLQPLVLNGWIRTQNPQPRKSL